MRHWLVKEGGIWWLTASAALSALLVAVVMGDPRPPAPQAVAEAPFVTPSVTPPVTPASSEVEQVTSDPADHTVPTEASDDATSVALRGSL